MFLLQNSKVRPRRADRNRPALSLLVVLRAIHGICVADGLYVVVLLFLLDALLVGSRLHVLHIWGYDFIWVNLILATVPYGSSLCADLIFRFFPQHNRWIQFLKVLLLIFLLAIWLLFLPNAPYVLTDFRHMQHWTNRQIAYDTIMLGTYSLTGFALGIASLVIMQRLVRAAFGPRVILLFVIACCFLSGIGVHLGRTLRYNSGDVFSQTGTILGTVLDRLAHLYRHPMTLFDGLFYGALLLAGYGAVIALGSKETRASIPETAELNRRNECPPEGY